MTPAARMRPRPFPVAPLSAVLRQLAESLRDRAQGPHSTDHAPALVRTVSRTMGPWR
jgi:hypothetical protein